MKRIGSCIVHSFVLFWSYFVSSSLCLMAMQTIMRMFVVADSKGEFLWKTIFMYAWMTTTCMVDLKITASTHKPKYLSHMKGKEWSFKDTVKYLLKNADFWEESIGFAIWPIVIPKLFGSIQRLYVSPEFLEAFPRALLSVWTVSVPILILSAIGWMIMLRLWYKKRLHIE